MQPASCRFRSNRGVCTAGCSWLVLDDVGAFTVLGESRVRLTTVVVLDAQVDASVGTDVNLVLAVQPFQLGYELSEVADHAPGHLPAHDATPSARPSRANW